MSDLAAAIRRATARLKRASLARKYDPNQPRVPAGSPDGGQWTDGGGGGGAASPRPSPRRLATRERESSASDGWTLRAREKIEGGERTLHAGPGGALIASERRTGPFTGARTSSHSVRMPDGSGLRIENDRTGVQRIFDARGNLLDVYEKMSADTVCVYDHKIGSSRLWPGRAKRLANTAARLMGPLVRRIIVIEVRPAL